MTSYKFALIDDSKFTRQLLKELLLKQGHKVVAELDLNGDAIQRCWELDVDMIFLSMSSSEEDGIRLLRDLIAAELYAPVVVICSGAQQELIMSAVRLGAKGYLLKPFHAEDVRECLEKHVVVREAVISQNEQTIGHFEEQDRPEWSMESIADMAYLEQREPLEQPASKPLEEIPFSVELESPQRLAEAIQLNSGIHFTRKEPEPTALAEGKNSAADVFSQAAAMELEEIEREPVGCEEDTLALDQPEVKEEPVQEELVELASPIMEKEEEIMREALHKVEDMKTEEMGFNNTEEIDRGLEKMARMFEQMQSMMTQMPAPVAAAEETRGPQAPAAEAPVQRERLIPGVLRTHPDQELQIRKRMTKTHMCNWNEDIDGETKQYLVVCTEGENKLNIEMGSLNKKQTLTFTLEGFFELVGWLEETVGRSAKRK